MDIIDFITGGLLMNAMPHFIFGITKTRFLGMFGFNPKANIVYAVVQFILCIVLFHVNHDIRTVLENGIFVGSVAVLFFFFIFGNLVLRFYQKK